MRREEPSRRRTRGCEGCRNGVGGKRRVFVTRWCHGDTSGVRDRWRGRWEGEVQSSEVHVGVVVVELWKWGHLPCFECLWTARLGEFAAIVVSLNIFVMLMKRRDVCIGESAAYE
jgi:hypothetical protein